MTAPVSSQVTYEENIGSWLNLHYDHDRMSNALQRVVFDRPPPYESKPLPLTIVPNGTINDFWLDLEAFCYGPTAKHQCYLLCYSVA